MRVQNLRDQDAWNEFDAIYRPILARYARARGLKHDRVEDVVQHCMVAIQGHVAGFEYDPDKGRFKSWLRTLVNNRVRDLLRRKPDHQADTGHLEIGQQREESPEEAFDKIWMDEHLSVCLRQVKSEVEPQTYEAFRRYVIRQEPIERVAEALQLTENNMYKIKWRVTQKLQEKLSVLLGPEE